MYGYVYKTTNVINGKIYIGQHKSDIFDISYYGSGRLLIKAIEKYGKNNFSIELLEKCSSKQELNQQEKYWISKFNSTETKVGYNIALGGDGGDIFTQLSPEAKEEKRRKHSEDTSSRIWVTDGCNNKYIKNTEQIPEGFHRGRTIDTSNIGKYIRTDEMKAKMRGRTSPLKGKHLSEETKEKLRKANLGKKYSYETNKKKGVQRFGKDNPMFGVHYKWLTNGSEDFKLFEKDWDKLEYYKSIGYTFGRSNKKLFKKVDSLCLNQ